METGLHKFHMLFQQLGLPAEAADIERFITDHRPLPAELKLADAPFWNDSQRRLLCQSLADDADWSSLVDQLSVSLR